MSETKNILLISDDNETAAIVKTKLALLRGSDSISTCETRDCKKILENSTYCIVILHEFENDNDETLKLIKSLKEKKINCEIILLLNKINPDFILQAYDNGIYDYITVNSDSYEILIKTVNCFKLRSIKEKNNRNEKFLHQLGVISASNGFYKYNYLKDIFIDISDDYRIQNGYFAILTLDEKNKTKISTNRLAGIIKNSVRSDDIIATARGGKFYLILPNINLEGTQALVNKIQEKMGTEVLIHSGCSKIGTKSFETLDKEASDSLISAIQNEKLCISISENSTNNDMWLEDETLEQKKDFKIFKNAFEKKLNNVITPVFFRTQKEFEVKLTNTQVSQYSNNVESVFSLKNDVLHSELIIRFNGFTKFKLEIIHSGLDSAENTKIEIPLKQLTEKELNKYLKQLKTEYKNSIVNRG